MEEILRGFLQHLAELEKADGDESGFSKEFSSIKKCLASISDQLDLSTEAGSARSNIKKNRYKDILPYDQTRVPLTLLQNEGYSDYINANFIRGIDGDKYYIATQGPLGQTVVDFWRMIWEYQVKKKCERYWATEEKDIVVFGPFTVTHVGEETLRDEVTIRTLSVTMLDDVDQRSIVQFQYSAWPDHGIPKDFDSLLEMIDLVHKSQGSLKSPICVHCSAGCGRTGVICTVDYVRSMLLRKAISKDFAVMDMVKEMRQQRPVAVQTKDQYEFTYRIIAEMFQRELEAAEHDYENLEKDGRPCGALDVRQPPPPKAAASSEPRSPALGAQAPGSMASQGAAGATYAAVGRRREGGDPRPVSSYVLPSSSGCAYENLGQAPGRPLSSSASSSYSAVGFDNGPRVLPQTTQCTNLHPLSTPAAAPHISTISYSTIAFGQQGSEPISHTDEDTAEWAPSLPERTADSYVIQDPGEVPASSPVMDSRNRTSKLPGPFKPAVLGGIEKKGATPSSDAAYEDVAGLSIASSFSSSGLGFNARVAKPKGPRPPPEAWAVYSH
ncbi:tyrosine-protein phosphatase non-receptor type 18 isoform X2 [Stegostoma tigrinum]|uniref:tyrosine-protein phosphatase non-receptor type 18 isoform X2 n=1 Tax=Stegostoma tigrinum TaxID=3053191 RepID=UPI00202B3D59|nr:tyrosine-protein phosphatase non-receptor type 18 isoform X2 [Stegostoma tigrinum]